MPLKCCFCLWFISVRGERCAHVENDFMGLALSFHWYMFLELSSGSPVCSSSNVTCWAIPPAPKRKVSKLWSFSSLCNSVLIQPKVGPLVLPRHHHAWHTLPFNADLCVQHRETEWTLGWGDDGWGTLFQNTFDWWEPKWVPLWTAPETLPIGSCVECVVFSWWCCRVKW